MIQPAVVNLRGSRRAPLDYVITFKGVDLTDVSMTAQVRQKAETPGDPEISLASGASAGTTGLRLISAGVVDGVMTSKVALFITESAMAAIPAAAPDIDQPLIWAWDLVIASAAGAAKARWLAGQFIVSPGVTTSGAASSNGGQGNDVIVSVANQQVTVEVSAAELAAPFVEAAAASATAAGAAETNAEIAADAAREAALRLTPFAVDVSSTLLTKITSAVAEGVAYADANFFVKYLIQNTGSSSNRVTIAKISDGSIVADFIGGTIYSGIRTIDVPNSDGSGITFKVRVDFGTGGSFFWTSGNASNAKLDPDKIVGATPSTIAGVADGLEEDPRFSGALSAGPWASVMTNTFLRRLITGIHLYHADRSAQYHVKKISFYGGTSNLNPYIRVFIGNFTSGATLLELQFDKPTPASTTGAAKTEFAAWLAATWKTYVATDENFSDNNRLAWLSFDWSVLPELAYGDYNYTTMALGGINPDRVYDDGTAGASYLDSDHYHELIDVAAGGTAITTAITGLQWVVPGISTRAHFHNRVRLRLAEGSHLSANAESPAYVELAGMGQSRTFVYRNGSTPREVLAGYRDTKVRDLTIVSDLSPQYPWHTDAANGRTFDNTGAQNRRFYQSFKNVDFVMTGDNVGQGFGCGISSGQVIDFEVCRAWHATTALPGSNYTSAPFFFHNTGKTSGFPTQNDSILPARVNMRSCSSSDDYVESIYLQTLERVALCTLSLTDCDFAMIKHEVVQGEVVTDLARDRVGWIITGVHRGAFQYKDLDGAIVLAAPTGVTITGALAAVMFGNVDELGRGDKWIKAGSTKSLGARLGNRTGNSESLTLNGTSWTPNTNLSASSNATIIASVLAATGVQLTEVDLRLEHYPAAAPVRRMNNNSGVLIPKGRFVKRTALGKIALAQPGDRIFGWTIRAIRNGDDGDVMIGRRIWWEYLDGVTSGQFNAGTFWLGADGTVTFSAPTIASLSGDSSALATAVKANFVAASSIGNLVGGTAEIW